MRFLKCYSFMRINVCQDSKIKTQRKLIYKKFKEKLKLKYVMLDVIVWLPVQWRLMFQLFAS